MPEAKVICFRTSLLLQPFGFQSTCPLSPSSSPVLRPSCCASLATGNSVPGSGAKPSGRDNLGAWMMIGQLGAKSDAWFKLVCFYLDPGWFVCFLSCVFLPQRVALKKYYRWFCFSWLAWPPPGVWEGWTACLISGRFFQKPHPDYALYHIKRARRCRDLLIAHDIHGQTMEYWNQGAYKLFHSASHLKEDGPANVGHKMWAVVKRCCFAGEPFGTAHSDGGFMEGFVSSSAKQPELVNALAWHLLFV